MPAYNFHKSFADAVEQREKRQTIRQTARGAQAGRTAYLYTGQRTKACRKLGEGAIVQVAPIEVGAHACGEPYAIVGIGRSPLHLTHSDLDAFARDDGFLSAGEMTAWFAGRYGLPFKGYLIRWE